MTSVKILKSQLKEAKYIEKKLKETPDLFIEIHRIKGNERYPTRFLMRFQPKGAMKFHLERDSIYDIFAEIKGMINDVFRKEVEEIEKIIKEDEKRMAKIKGD